MSDGPWWQSGVIYEIAVPAFADSNGDGIGDLRGIIGRLDHLKGGSASLGVDAIWLTPVTLSPMRDFGYDVADYRAIDPRFGTMRDFEDLLSACHERGLKVMMDLVLNHTSDEHPWFVASRSSRDDPKRGWYVWRDGRAPGKPPNRWAAVVEGSAWQYDRATDQYYYHAFLPFQPDLDWRNPHVRREMLGVAEYWLDKGVDGFRLDLINFLVEDEQLRDNPFKFGSRPYLAQRHVYDISQPESVEVARDLRRLVDAYDDRAMMGEVYTEEPEDCVAFLGEGDALHLSFYMDLLRRPWSASQYRDAVGWLESRLPAGGWPCYYLNNHDLKRTYGRLGGPLHAEAKAKVTAAMLLTLRGTPIVYYGEEIGMPTSRVPRSALRDPVGQKFWPYPAGRDGSRTPMQWSAAANAGFTSGDPWLPVDRSHASRNVERQDGDPDSLLAWYRRLLGLRAATPALRGGTYRALEPAPSGVFGYVRGSGGQSVAVLLNFRSRTSTAIARGATEGLPAGWRTLASTHEGAGRSLEVPRLSEVRLQPFEALILEASG